MENQVRMDFCFSLAYPNFSHVGECQRDMRWQGWNESSVLLTRGEKNAPAANVVVWLRSYASWALIHRYLPLASSSLLHHSVPLHSCSHSRAHKELYTRFLARLGVF